MELLHGDVSIFDGDVIHGSKLGMVHAEFISKFGTGFCILIVETQRLLQFSGLCSNFRVPNVFFFCSILQVLTSKRTEKCGGPSRMVPAWDFAKLLRKRSVSRGISIWSF